MQIQYELLKHRQSEYLKAIYENRGKQRIHGKSLLTFLPRALTLMWPQYAEQGCHLWLNSLDDVDNVSEPTMTPKILSSTSLSESEVEVSLQSAVSFFKPDKILLAICAFIYGMPLSLTSSP